MSQLGLIVNLGISSMERVATASKHAIECGKLQGNTQAKLQLHQRVSYSLWPEPSLSPHASGLQLLQPRAGPWPEIRVWKQQAALAQLLVKAYLEEPPVILSVSLLLPSAKIALARRSMLVAYHGNGNGPMLVIDDELASDWPARPNSQRNQTGNRGNQLFPCDSLQAQASVVHAASLIAALSHDGVIEPITMRLSVRQIRRARKVPTLAGDVWLAHQDFRQNHVAKSILACLAVQV